MAFAVWEAMASVLREAMKVDEDVPAPCFPVGNGGGIFVLADDRGRQQEEEEHAPCCFLDSHGLYAGYVRRHVSRSAPAVYKKPTVRGDEGLPSDGRVHGDGADGRVRTT